MVKESKKKKKNDKKVKEPFLPIDDRKWKSKLREVSKHK